MSEGIVDPRTRRFLLPTRIVWTSGAGVANSNHLLREDETTCELYKAEGGRVSSILVDFGKELHGSLRLSAPTTSSGKYAKVRVRFGESVSEAMGEPNNDHTIHDFEAKVAWMGHTEIGLTGFRFARIDLLDTETSLTLRQVHAVSIMRDIPYKGAFESNDARLNQIWQTGAYTVHLCMQDHVWDGIKRDRLVWIGDLHPEAMVISTVFGNHPIVPESLDYVRDRTPLPQWMNGISSYSLWWVMLHHDWYKYHGDLNYLRQQRPYLLGLLKQIEAKVANDGKEILDGHRFLEWPTSEDPTAIDSGLQALVVLTLRAGAALCKVLGEEGAAQSATRAADSAMLHNRKPSLSKQANALAVLAQMKEPRVTNQSLLSADPYRGLSTFYGYYILQARALAGDYTGCLDLIRNYWGGMLDMGATSFWEGFEIDWMTNTTRIDELPKQDRKDVHADFGKYCYVGLRHSLCHGWAAGPTAWLSEHVLGITPASPGFKTVRIQPQLGGLEFARGTFPTPQGIITVEHTKQKDGSIKSDIKLPRGVKRVS
jgi:hypothetical protein